MGKSSSMFSVAASRKSPSPRLFVGNRCCAGSGTNISAGLFIWCLNTGRVSETNKTLCHPTLQRRKISHGHSEYYKDRPRCPWWWLLQASWLDIGGVEMVLVVVAWPLLVRTYLDMKR